ncbi:MAG: nucleotidyltransferase family protein [Synechococcaceae cyanobacterium SM2_3_1]|nr:nucleotidyltransferase family protein [Synechococcaceae cyanobacterium SM2_3_1]
MTRARQLPIRIPHDQIVQFCQQHHIRQLALFGSVLREDSTSTSDIDILEDFEPGHTPGFAFIDLQDQLSEMLGQAVDLNTPQDLSRYFRDQVITEAEVIYDQSQN